MMGRCLVVAVLAATLVVPTASPAGAHAAGNRPSGRLSLVKRVFYVHQPAGTRSLGSLGSCPAAATCASFGVGRARWPVDSTGRATLSFRYNDAGRPSRAPATDTARGALRRAAAQWNAWNSNISFVDAGTTAARPGSAGPSGSCSDGVNTVGWRPLGSGVLGVTFICYDVRTLRIHDADTAMNSLVGWAAFTAPAPASAAFDLQSVFTHELGHWLSLTDLGGLRASAQTMYGAGRPGLIRQRTLALGDIVGSQTAYPCGPGDSCPRTGIAND